MRCFTSARRFAYSASVNLPGLLKLVSPGRFPGAARDRIRVNRLNCAKGGEYGAAYLRFSAEITRALHRSLRSVQMSCIPFCALFWGGRTAGRVTQLLTEKRG